MDKRGLLNTVLFCVATSLGCTEQVGDAQPNYDGHEAEPAESESEGERVVICEETIYTQDEFNAAFETARRELADEGYEAVPLIWEDEEHLTELVDYMVAALGCVSESSRRAGGGVCQRNTDLSRYMSETFYCGDGAWTGSSLACGRAPVGDCLNQVCYRHDLCYDAFLAASDGPICIWSSDTEDCDRVFHTDVAVCITQRQCGFWCMVMATIAAYIDNIQNVAGIAGQKCLYDTDCSDGDLRSCGPATYGVCRPGAQTCRSGQWSECEGVVEPSEELCDELDNDCDGLVDNPDSGACTCIGRDFSGCVNEALCDWDGGEYGRCIPAKSDEGECAGLSIDPCEYAEKGCIWSKGDYGECTQQDGVDGSESEGESESEAESESECVLASLGRDCDAGDPAARAGCCCGTVLRYCYETNQVDGRDCDTTGDLCGWKPGLPGYDCGGSGEDPSGTYPLECAGL